MPQENLAQFFLEQLAQLKKAFPKKSHYWRVGPKWSEVQVKAFEKKYKVRLPHDYRSFLIQVGDGGAGFAYDADKPSRIRPLRKMKIDDLNTPFKAGEIWKKGARGALWLGHTEDGGDFFLVIKGPKSGQVLIDGIAYEGGRLGSSKKTYGELNIAWAEKLLKETKGPNWKKIHKLKPLDQLNYFYRDYWDHVGEDLPSMLQHSTVEVDYFQNLLTKIPSEQAQKAAHMMRSMLNGLNNKTFQKKLQPIIEKLMYVKRPSGVPSKAVWNEKNKEWELGTKKNGVATGKWKWWDANGRFISYVSYNNKGKLNGIGKRYNRYGQVVYLVRYQDGKIIEKKFFKVK